MTITELRALSQLLSDTAGKHIANASDALVRQDLPYARAQHELAHQFNHGARGLLQLADAFETLTPLITSQK